MKAIESITIADDLIVGAGNIAKFLYGDEKLKRRVYAMVSAGEIPVFKIADTLHARRSTLIEHLAQLEAKALSTSSANG